MLSSIQAPDVRQLHINSDYRLARCVDLPDVNYPEHYDSGNFVEVVVFDGPDLRGRYLAFAVGPNRGLAPVGERATQDELWIYPDQVEEITH